MAAAERQRKPGEHGATGEHARAATEDGFGVPRMPFAALDCHDELTIQDADGARREAIAGVRC
jgi:hypothetical protein